MTTSPAEAARRVRAFVEARARHRRPMVDRPTHQFMTPGHIAAEYGRLEIADLLALCDATEALHPADSPPDP